MFLARQKPLRRVACLRPSRALTHRESLAATDSAAAGDLMLPAESIEVNSADSHQIDQHVE